MDRARSSGLALLADSLTALRLLIALALIPIAWAGSWGTVGAILSLAWLTDFLDGRMARFAAVPTRLGRWDMAADTAVGTGLVIGLAGHGLLPPWAAAGGILLFGGLFLAGNLAAGMLLQLLGFVPFLVVIWQERPALWWLPFITLALIAGADWRRLVSVNIPNFIRGLAGRFEHG